MNQALYAHINNKRKMKKKKERNVIKNLHLKKMQIWEPQVRLTKWKFLRLGERIYLLMTSTHAF
jgi:hypothetical protein